MKHVLVTGATGGLGRNAVQTLLSQGVAVRATGRNLETGAELSALGAEFIALDLAHPGPSSIADLVDSCDTVWHCAGMSSTLGALADYEAVNVTATEQLARAAYVAGVKRFVHISTAALYFDFTHRHGICEAFRPAGYACAYAASKSQAEHKVLALAKIGLHVTVLRPGMLFGEHDQVLVPRLLQLLERNGGQLTLPRGGRTKHDLTYVGNVVHAMRLASTRLDLDSGEVFNITNRQPMPFSQALEALFIREMGIKLQLRSLPYSVLSAVVRAKEALATLRGQESEMTRYALGALKFDMTLDNARAQAILGYLPQITVDQGIVRTANWLKSRKR